MERLILVEIDVRDKDPQKCGKRCPGIVWNDDNTRALCEMFLREPLESKNNWPMRCADCLDAGRKFDEVSDEIKRLTVTICKECRCKSTK